MKNDEQEEPTGAALRWPDLVDAVCRVKCAPAPHISSVNPGSWKHKPVLLLWGLSRWDDGERYFQYVEWAETFDTVLSPVISDARGPEQPFWRLQNDGGTGRPPIWSVQSPLEVELGSHPLSSRELTDAHAIGKFTTWVERLLSDIEDGPLLLAREVVSHHLRSSKLFPQRRIEAICDAVEAPAAAVTG